MALHRKILYTGGSLLAGGVVVLVVNFAYMYNLLSQCVASKQCTPYPFWDILNAAAIIAAGSGLVMVVIGTIMLFRAADRADDESEAKAAAEAEAEASSNS